MFKRISNQTKFSYDADLEEKKKKAEDIQFVKDGFQLFLDKL